MCGAPGSEPKSKIHDENEKMKGSSENTNEMKGVTIENAGNMENKYIIPELAVNPGKHIYPVAFDDFEKIDNVNGLNGSIDRLKSQNSSNDRNCGKTMTF